MIPNIRDIRFEAYKKKNGIDTKNQATSHNVVTQHIKDSSQNHQPKNNIISPEKLKARIDSITGGIGKIDNRLVSEKKSERPSINIDYIKERLQQVNKNMPQGNQSASPDNKIQSPKKKCEYNTREIVLPLSLTHNVKIASSNSITASPTMSTNHNNISSLTSTSQKCIESPQDTHKSEYYNEININIRESYSGCSQASSTTSPINHSGASSPTTSQKCIESPRVTDSKALIKLEELEIESRVASKEKELLQRDTYLKSQIDAVEKAKKDLEIEKAMMQEMIKKHQAMIVDLEKASLKSEFEKLRKNSDGNFFENHHEYSKLFPSDLPELGNHTKNDRNLSVEYTKINKTLSLNKSLEIFANDHNSHDTHLDYTLIKGDVDIATVKNRSNTSCDKSPNIDDISFISANDHSKKDINKDIDKEKVNISSYVLVEKDDNSCTVVHEADRSNIVTPTPKPDDSEDSSFEIIV